MPASKQFKTLSVRLPAAEVRELKILAASRGISLQEAVHRALEDWASPGRKIRPEPLGALQGSLAGKNIQRLMRREREAELVKDRRWSKA